MIDAERWTERLPKNSFWARFVACRDGIGAGMEPRSGRETAPKKGRNGPISGGGCRFSGRFWGSAATSGLLGLGPLSSTSRHPSWRLGARGAAANEAGDPTPRRTRTPSGTDSQPGLGFDPAGDRRPVAHRGRRPVSAPPMTSAGGRCSGSRRGVRKSTSFRAARGGPARGPRRSGRARPRGPAGGAGRSRSGRRPRRRRGPCRGGCRPGSAPPAPGGPPPTAAPCAAGPRASGTPRPAGRGDTP